MFESLKGLQTSFSSAQLKEIKASLVRIKNTCPGPDGILNTFLRYLPDNALVYLTNLYNEIWISKSFPDKWRESMVIPVLKPNKDPSKAENYRPIALTSTICKLMEKVINKRLLWLLDNKGFLIPHQYGFRKYRNTTDHLENMETLICDAFITKQHLIAIK